MIASGDVSNGGTHYIVYTPAAAAQVISPTPARLCKVLVTVAGTTAATIYDNATAASGTIIGYIAASTAVGTLIDFQMPAEFGITVGGATTAPGLTITVV